MAMGATMAWANFGKVVYYGWAGWPPLTPTGSFPARSPTKIGLALANFCIGKMTMNDPSTGPLSRETFKKLVDAPYGQAKKEIQKIDPLYGREPGELIEWKVRFRADMMGTAFVKATSEEEAENLAAELSPNDVDWDTYTDDFDVIDVEPSR
jgi:hypothetical protein